MKKIKLGLLPQILIAIGLGIAAGTVSPALPVRIFVTFNALFSQFLNFIIPLIIVGLVTPAIADIGKGAGKMLVATVLLAYGATLFSGFLSFGVGETFFPSLITRNIPLEEISEAKGTTPFFTISIPEPLNVMTALVMAFTVGLGLAHLDTGYLKNACNDFKEIIVKTIQAVILPLLPIYIFGIFFNMTHSGQVFHVLAVFVKIIGIYFTALGTQSSAATIPVTLKQTIRNGVHEGIAGFVIPLCATIHLSGSTMKIVACALALMMMQDIPYDFQMFSGFIFMLGVTMVAAPGVPGGAIMASLGILSSMLGFDENAQALMIALYIAMDSFGTACNVTGDGALALIIDKWFGPSKSQHQ